MRTLGKRVYRKVSRVRIPHLPPIFRIRILGFSNIDFFCVFVTIFVLNHDDLAINRRKRSCVVMSVGVVNIQQPDTEKLAIFAVATNIERRNIRLAVIAAVMSILPQNIGKNVAIAAVMNTFLPNIRLAAIVAVIDIVPKNTTKDKVVF